MGVDLISVGRAESHADWADPIRASLDLVEKKLAAAASSDVDVATELSMRLFSAGGKRIRPALTILSALASGGGHDDERIIDLAAAGELVHTASLVHDDVIDETVERRGIATTNAQWGNKLSVLGGDFLLSKAFCLVAEIGNADVLMALSRLAVRMSEAEMLQAMSEGSVELWEANYWAIIGGKTAAFMEVCCECGASLVSADRVTRRALAEYGLHLGLAFQVTDDLLDIVGDPAVTGKGIGTDLLNGKYTLPVLVALRDPGVGERCRALLPGRGGSLSEDDAREVAALVERCGAAEEARRTAREHSHKAISSLNDVPASDYTASLEQLAASIAQRWV